MVATSLFTGLSGLRAHQRLIDVIGNNLANVSTPGFWGSRVAFSSLLSATLTPGQGPSGTSGGQNPMQVGLGSQIGSIDPKTTPGPFQNTGRPLDVAIKGSGFFALTDGNRTLFTRVGSFGVDQARKLVDVRTGMRVIASDGGEIEIPLTGTLPAERTQNIKFEGALPADVKGPLAEIVSSTAPFLDGQAATKASTSAQTQPMNLSTLDNTSFTVSVNGGSPQTVNITAAALGVTNLNSVTFAEFITGVENQVTGISVTESGGLFTLTTDKVGASATLKLDNQSGTPLAFFGFDTVLSKGSQTAATGTTSLNQLTINNQDYAIGDQITVSGTDPSGNKVGGTFTFGAANDGTTLNDFVTFLNSMYSSTSTTGATAAIGSDGTITVTANSEGEANLSLVVSETSTTAKTNWTSFQVTRDGTGPDTAETSIDVFDTLGRSHRIAMTFTRDDNDPNTWNLTATMDADSGTITDSTINGISFNQDGSFSTVSDSSTLEFQFNGITAAQTINLNFGTTSSFDGLTMTGDKSTAAATDQDGFAAGNLLNVGFSEDGNLQGFYSNGKTSNLAELRMVLIPNPGGVLRVGDTLFAESPNSDSPILTTAGKGGAGTIVSGVLEGSNVEIAEEFVALIEAQRGFQANARVITTTDQVLSELLNIVR